MAPLATDTKQEEMEDVGVEVPAHLRAFPWNFLPAQKAFPFPSISSPTYPLWPSPVSSMKPFSPTAPPVIFPFVLITVFSSLFHPVLCMTFLYIHDNYIARSLKAGSIPPTASSILPYPRLGSSEMEQGFV